MKTDSREWDVDLLEDMFSKLDRENGTLTCLRICLNFRRDHELIAEIHLCDFSDDESYYRSKEVSSDYSAENTRIIQIQHGN